MRAAISGILVLLLATACGTLPRHQYAGWRACTGEKSVVVVNRMNTDIEVVASTGRRHESSIIAVLGPHQTTELRLLPPNTTGVGVRRREFGPNGSMPRAASADVRYKCTPN